MRRLYPRGAANGGICVDPDGATLGPDCVLVGRTQHGFRAIERARALTLQKCIMGTIGDDDWLFRQCQRISDALNKGEIALAQIYGLRIPIGELDDVQLRRLGIAGFVKQGFNPDESRVPKGNPHGGEWTTGGDGSETPADAASGNGAASGNVDDGMRGATGDEGGDEGGGDDGAADDAGNGLVSLSDVVLPDSSPPDDVGSSNAGEAAPDDPGMEYRFVGPASGTAAPPGAAAGTMAAADTAATTLLGPLSAETLAGLAGLAAQMSGPTLFLGILFIPSNGSPVVDGTVAGVPDLSTSYDLDTGAIQVWRDGGPLGARILLDTGHIGVDGLFYDQNGVAIARALSNGAIVDPDTLPGYRSQTSAGAGADARSQAIADTATQPKLCPDPGPDQPGAPLDNPYQQFIGQLINGEPLPPGLAVNLWNPLSGKLVHFDDCQLSTGIMVEAKGTGYAAILASDANSFIWGQIEEKMIKQAAAQLQAAQGRPIEWYFAESSVANRLREVFENRDFSIAVIYMPAPRWTP